MNPLIATVLLLVAASATAAPATTKAARDTEWGDGWFRQEWFGTPSITLSLGSPAQRPTRFYIDPFISTRGSSRLQIGNAADKSGPFNTTASETFKYIRPIPRQRDCFTGSDTVQVKNGPKIPVAEIDVMSYYRDVDEGYVDLNPGERGERSFTDIFLAELGGDQAVVIDLHPSPHSVEGNITFGNATPASCSQHWNVYPARDEAPFLFTIETDEIQVGNYANAARVPLTFHSKNLHLDYETYGAVMKELNVSKNRSISCHESKSIEIKAGGMKWSIGPDVYRQTWPFNGCSFNVFESVVDVIQLPLTMMRGHCIRYDFGLDTVSIAERH